MSHELILVDQYLSSYFRRQEELGYLGRADEPMGTGVKAGTRHPTAQGVETRPGRAGQVPVLAGHGILDATLDAMRARDPARYARLKMEYDGEFQELLAAHRAEVRVVKAWLAKLLRQ